MRETIDSIVQAMDGMRIALEGKADANRVRSLVAISDEGILIQAKEIALVGSVTIADIINDQNGTSGGKIDARITRIVGDKIQTGSIRSNNWGADRGTAIDLDNETVIMGGSANPKFIYDGEGNLSISGELRAGSVISDTVVIDRQEQGQIDLGSLIDLAEETITQEDVINMLQNESASILVASEQFLRMQNQSNSASVTVGSAGIVATDAGGSPTFTLNALTGAATFKGDITGATGTFSGTAASADTASTALSVNGGGVFSGDLSAAGGTFSGSLSAANGTFQGDVETSGRLIATGGNLFAGQMAAIHATPSGLASGVYAASVSAFGIHGQSTNSTGVRGLSSAGEGVYGSSNGSGVGVRASHSSTSGVALQIGTGKITKPRVTGHHVQIYPTATPDVYEYRFF